jgi:hypothetical protein
MFSFYTIVIIIAIVIMIIMLTLVGLTLANKHKGIEFPDNEHTCPDFWTLDTDGVTCKSSSLNTVPPAAIPRATRPGFADVAASNSNPYPYQAINTSEGIWASICDKAKWAKKYGILWDTVTNSNKC